MVNVRFRKRFYCLVATVLFSFAVYGNNLYAASDSGSGDLPIVVNDSRQDAEELKVGEKAPDFTLTSIDGKSAKLSDFLFQVAVFYFWASSSPESDRITADVAELEKQYKGMDIIFVGISLDVNKADWQAAVKSAGLKGPQLSELKNLENANIAKLYGLEAIPAVFILDPSGVIVGIEKTDVNIPKKLEDVFGR